MGSFEKRASGLDTKMEDVRQAFLIRLARKGEDLHQTLIEISEMRSPEMRIRPQAWQLVLAIVNLAYWLCKSRRRGHWSFPKKPWTAPIRLRKPTLIWSKPRWIHKSSQRAGMSMIKVNQAYWKAFLQCRLIALSCGTVFQI